MSDLAWTWAARSGEACKTDAEDAAMRLATEVLQLRDKLAEPRDPEVVEIRRVQVYVTDSDDPEDGDVFLTVTLADGTRKQVTLAGSPAYLDAEVSAYELRTGRTV